MDKMYFNIGIVGPVSTGKSTFINSLLQKKCTEMALKRTTMVPQIYYEGDKCDDNILDKNNNANQNYSNNNDLIEVMHEIPRIISNNLLHIDNYYIKIYDIPGINDSETSEQYKKYLKSILPNLDLILLFLDVNSAMNTSDEVAILDIIINYIKEYKNMHMITVLNKYDDIIIEKNNELILDYEYKEIFNQVKSILDKKELIPNNICVLSSFNAYIYRVAINNINNLDIKHKEKLGEEIFGKRKWLNLPDDEKMQLLNEELKNIKITEILNLNGFNKLMDTINNIYIDNKLAYSNKNINKLLVVDCDYFIENPSKISSKVIDIYKEFKKINCHECVVQKLDNIINDIILKYNVLVANTDNDVINLNKLLKFMLAIIYDDNFSTILNYKNLQKYNEIYNNIIITKNNYYISLILNSKNILEITNVLNSNFEKPLPLNYEKNIIDNICKYISSSYNINNDKEDDIIHFIDILHEYSLGEDDIYVIFCLLLNNKINNNNYNDKVKLQYYNNLKYVLLPYCGKKYIANLLIKIDGLILLLQEKFIITDLNIFECVYLNLEEKFIENIQSEKKYIKKNVTNLDDILFREKVNTIDIKNDVLKLNTLVGDTVCKDLSHQINNIKSSLDNMCDKNLVVDIINLVTNRDDIGTYNCVFCGKKYERFHAYKDHYVCHCTKKDNYNKKLVDLVLSNIKEKS